MESKTLKVKYAGYAKILPLPDNYNSFVESVIKAFNIDPNQKANLSFGYLDSEGDRIILSSEEDYNMIKISDEKQLKIFVNNNAAEKEEKVPKFDKFWGFHGKNKPKGFAPQMFGRNFKKEKKEKNSSDSDQEEDFEKKFEKGGRGGRGRGFFGRHHGPHGFHMRWGVPFGMEGFEKFGFKKHMPHQHEKEDKPLNAVCINHHLKFLIIEKSEDVSTKVNLLNNGKEKWPSNVFVGNIDNFPGIKGDNVNVGKEVNPQEKVEVEIKLPTKDLEKGKYLSVWGLKNDKNELIGRPFMIKVVVCSKEEKEQKMKKWEEKKKKWEEKRKKWEEKQKQWEGAKK